MNTCNSCMYFLHETGFFRIHKRPQNATYHRRGRHIYRDSNPNHSRCADALFASCAYKYCVFYYRKLGLAVCYIVTDVSNKQFAFKHVGVSVTVVGTEITYVLPVFCENFGHFLTWTTE